MKILHLAIIAIMALSTLAVIYMLPQAAGSQYSPDQNYPILDMSKIMSAAEHNTDFIEKTERYDHYLLAKATLVPIQEKTGNVTQEEYDLVYSLYRDRNNCYFENLVAVTLDASLNVTSVKEYSLYNEPDGYPRPPISCLMNLEPSKMDYNPLLIILAPSPFATVNETFNASSDGTIVFSGTVHKLFSKYVTLSVFNPRGDLIAISQPQPESDGRFSQTFQPFSPLWSMTGNYTVSIASGTHNLVESPFYFSGVGCCMTESPLHYADQGLPPLEQWKSYVPARNTICAKDLQLVIKAEDSSPACVKTETAQKLIERGWAIKNTSLNYSRVPTKITSQVFPTNAALSVGEPSVKGYLTSIDGTALPNKQINIIIDNATFENGSSIENILVGKTLTDQDGCFYLANWDQAAVDRFQKDMAEKTPQGAPTDLVSIKAVFTGDSKYQGSSNATKFTYYTVAVPIIRPALSAFLVNGSDIVLEKGKSYNFTDFSTWGEALQLHTLRIEMKNLPCGIYEKTREISVANNQTQAIIPIELRVEKTAPIGNFTTYISVNNQAL
ncbi:MAG: hypothetical protein KGL95_13025, partial [Patescibacteria group bacterium]|nr:hypothetical protein [Patescibacteria group bacterium]